MENNTNESVKNEELSENAKPKFYQSTAFIVLVCVFSLVAIFFAIVTIAVSSGVIDLRDLLGIERERVDYENDDLSEFINISEEDYKGYDIVVGLRKPTYELDVEQSILALLMKNRGEKLFDSRYQYDIAITPGDRVFIYYAGYFLDEEGKRTEIASLTNYDESEPTQLTLGSGDFPLGFELSLVGKNPKDSAEFKAKTRGAVSSGEIVYLRASYVDENGLLHDNEDIRIDLSRDDAEGIWGAGILSYLQEKNIGQVNSAPITLSTEKGKIYYTSIEVKYTTSCESEGMVSVVKATYADDFEDDPSIAGKEVYFDVFIEKVMCYENHEFNDAFITDVLKISDANLSSYEGETLVEKFKKRQMEILMEEYKDDCRRKAEELMWEHLLKEIEYTLPEDEYEIYYSEVYNSFVTSLTEMNGQGNTVYASVDEYIIDYYGLDEEADVGEFLRETVKTEMKQKTIYNHILKVENSVPTDAEFDAFCRKELESNFEYNKGKTASDFESAEEYEKALADFEKEIIDYYGEEGYIAEMKYVFAVETLLAMANIIY